VKVAVCDYGAGNVRSVLAALGRIGVRGEATADAEVVAAADVAILPGVGSARSAMAELRRSGVADALRTRTGLTLGICLGLQLALERSDEDGGVDGLGLLPGRATRLAEGRVPRIGWADVDWGGAPAATYWFAHGYAAETPAVTAVSEAIVAEARGEAFVGCQFHPERSGPAGLRYLERCLSLA
jgi:glutamine amidotransferase